MTLPQSLGNPLVKPVPVSAGGTGATSVVSAQERLDVPSLTGDNLFTGTNQFNGPVTVTDELLDVTGTNGARAQRFITVDGARTCTWGDPDYTALTADRHIEPPDANGTIIVSGDTPAAGTILYFDGTVWKCLAAPGDALAHTLTITSGVLSWV